MWERLVRRLNILEALKFVTISFPISCLFAIIAETGRIWVSFRGLNFLELKVKNFTSFTFG